MAGRCAFIDNDISAYSSKPRPGAMLRDSYAGLLQVPGQYGRPARGRAAA
ncbi:hypothetical protein [Cellulomonas sp. ICMP 17802]